jgi:hypothetical protein
VKGISLSPFWYVTSRKRFDSSSRYIASTVRSIIVGTLLADAIGMSSVR